MAEQTLTPHYFTKNLETIMKFYTEKLGFKVDMTWPDTGTPRWCRLDIEGNKIMFGESMEDAPVDEAHREFRNEAIKRIGNLGPGTLFIEIADVDAHYKHTKSSGARIVSEPHDQFYGLRDYVTEDPDGNLLTFCSPLKK